MGLKDSPSQKSNLQLKSNMELKRTKQKSAMNNINYKNSKDDFEQELRNRYPELSRPDMLHTGIADWENFNKKLQDPNYALPTENIYDIVDVNSWKNIPIPLQEATEQFELCFINLGNILSEMIYEQ